MCYVSNNARKISVNYHYIGRYRAPVYTRTFDRKLMDKRRDRIQFHRTVVYRVTPARPRARDKTIKNIYCPSALTNNFL